MIPPRPLCNRAYPGPEGALDGGKIQQAVLREITLIEVMFKGIKAVLCTAAACDLCLEILSSQSFTL